MEVGKPKLGRYSSQQEHCNRPLWQEKVLEDEFEKMRRKERMTWLKEKKQVEEEKGRERSKRMKKKMMMKQLKRKQVKKKENKKKKNRKKQTKRQEKTNKMVTLVEVDEKADWVNWKREKKMRSWYEMRLLEKDLMCSTEENRQEKTMVEIAQESI